MRSIKTPWGVEWPLPESSDFLVFVIFIGVIIALFALVGYLLIYSRKKTEEYRGFIYRLKQMGLNSIQINLLLSLKKDLSVKNYPLILKDASLLETYIPRYIETLSVSRENGKPVKVPLSVYRDLVVMMEKLYHAKPFRNPLDSMSEVEVDTSFCIYVNNGAVAGKFIGFGDHAFIIRPLHDHGIPNDFSGKVVAYFWRSGDSEYTFESTMKLLEDGTMSLDFPQSFSRGKEVRRPYIEVLIPCRIVITLPSIKKEKEPDEEPKKEYVPGLIMKINDTESVVRIDTQLDPKAELALDFDLNEFKIMAGVKVLSSQAAPTGADDTRRFMYSFKFDQLSEASLRVLKNFVAKQMQNM